MPELSDRMVILAMLLTLFLVFGLVFDARSRSDRPCSCSGEIRHQTATCPRILRNIAI